MGSEVRITIQTLKVLGVLLGNPSAGYYGLEISKLSALPTGSIYPILTRLETAGWITSSWEEINESAEGRRRRRYYQLSPQGAQRAETAMQRMKSMLPPPEAVRPLRRPRPQGA
jgi:PadR family transcriptional regulator PadR